MDWTAHVEHFDKMAKENEMIEAERLQTFVLQYPTPHFYPGLAEEELCLATVAHSDRTTTEETPLQKRAKAFAQKINARISSAGPR